MHPLISVIVPVYKVPQEYLDRCVKSICNQTLKNIEIILVDDGSPDNCGDLCNHYALYDSRIVVIHKKNGGLCSARNAGYFVARGKWITFVDGDDWIEPDACEKLYDVAIKYQVEVVMCNVYRDYKYESHPYKVYLKSEYVYKNDECRWLQEQLLHYDSHIAMVYGKLISKSYLKKYNILHNEELRQGAEGLVFNIELFDKLSSAIYIDNPLYHYIYNENSISALHNEKNHEYVIKCFEYIQNYLKQGPFFDSLEPWINNRLLYVIITTAISGYFSPTNKEPLKIKIYKFKKYLEYPIIKKALKTKNLKGLELQRKIILFLISHNMFIFLDFLGKMRRFQKQHR